MRESVPRSKSELALIGAIALAVLAGCLFAGPMCRPAPIADENAAVTDRLERIEESIRITDDRIGAGTQAVLDRIDEAEFATMTVEPTVVPPAPAPTPEHH